MSALLYLTSLAIVFVFGIACTVLASKLKIPNHLLLILVGIIFNHVHYKGVPLVSFPTVFITSMALLALVMIIFDSCSRFSIKEIDEVSLPVLKLTVIFLILNMIFLSIATYYIFGVENVFVVLLFASLMSGTSPDAVMTLFPGKTNRLLDILKIESVFNTPIMVLIPFVILDLMTTITDISVDTFIEQISPFLQQFIAGIGAGVVIGILVFKLMRKTYSERLSPLAIITAALLAYILAEKLNGNGVLAVTTLGLVFGNIAVKEKSNLVAFSAMFSNALEILVFVLIGLIITIPINYTFFLKSIGLFLIFLLIRFASVYLTFKHVHKPDPKKKKSENVINFNIKQMIFMAVSAPKGIAVAAVVFTLAAYNIPSVSALFDLILVFVIYSLVATTVMSKFSRYFIRLGIKTDLK